MIPTPRIRVVLVIGVLLLPTACSGRNDRPDGESGGQPQPVPNAGGSDAATAKPSGEDQNRHEVLVLFASGEDELLHAQKRTILWTTSLEGRAKQALSELIAGPTEGLLPVLPEDVRVRELYLLPDGTAFVDFSREMLGFHGGSAMETAAVYAIVDTLALNFPEIRRVGILVDGQEIQTLGGHLDMRRPYRPDPSRLDEDLAKQVGLIDPYAKSMGGQGVEGEGAREAGAAADGSTESPP